MTHPDQKTALRRRTIRAFGILALGALLSWGAWQGATHSPDAEGIPTFFRGVLELNGSIWQRIYRPSRTGHHSPPPGGKKPRVNGDIGLKSPIDIGNWKMELVTDGDRSDAKRFSVSLAELRALPKTETAAEFYCIEGWSDPISYGGVRFSDFLDYYHLDRSFRYVGLETPDGEYYVSIDMDSMLHPQTVLAYEMNGAPLDLPNGAPLRLVIPVKYGIKSLKRIGKIFFSNVRPPDYWAEQGYDWFAGL